MSGPDLTPLRELVETLAGEGRLEHAQRLAAAIDDLEPYLLPAFGGGAADITDVSELDLTPIADEVEAETGTTPDLSPDPEGAVAVEAAPESDTAAQTNEEAR